MRKRRPKRGLRRDQRSHLGPFRLVLEPLESRRLLAGLNDEPYNDEPYVDIAAPPATHAAADVLGPARLEERPEKVPLAPGESAPAPEESLPETQQLIASSSSLAILESAPHGTLVGPLQIVGEDQDGNYDISLSDDRFVIEDGNLYFIAGYLDHATEPVITLGITALDYYSDHWVSTEATIAVLGIERPTATLGMTGGQVPENEPGAEVGQLQIVGDDAVSGSYAYYVFDSRFTVVGSTLKLVSGVALDYETEPAIDLTVAATDGSHEIFAQLAIEVLDRDESGLPLGAVELDGHVVEELDRGATVGNVSVTNATDDSYEFSVSDDRFEIVGQRLKLRDDQYVTLQDDAPLALTISAHGSQGHQASGQFTLDITPYQSIYHNARLPEDVNGDGYVSPIDVLTIVNRLNLNGTYAVPSGGTATGEPPDAMPDVNDDGIVSPVDALIIINYINRLHASDSWVNAGKSSELQAEDETPLSPPLPPGPSGDPADLKKRRENADVDAELEVLLDQLARASGSLSAEG